MDWGGPPKDPKNPGPNEFNTVHSIQISADRRLFVVDRTHRRFQIFDENGKFLDMLQPASDHRRTRTSFRPTSSSGSRTAAPTGSSSTTLNGHYLYGGRTRGPAWPVQRTSLDDRRSGRQLVPG
jgi:hypothetical protein